MADSDRVAWTQWAKIVAILVVAAAIAMPHEAIPEDGVAFEEFEQIQEHDFLGCPLKRVTFSSHILDESGFG